MPFKTLYVNVSTNSEVGAQFKREVESAGAKVVRDPKLAEVSITILEQKREKEAASLSTAGRIRKYSLYYVMKYQIMDRENNMLVEPASIYMRRMMTYNESESYAKDIEERLLYDEMEKDAFRQIIQRLVEVKMEMKGDPEPEI